MCDRCWSSACMGSKPVYDLSDQGRQHMVLLGYMCYMYPQSLRNALSYACSFGFQSWSGTLSKESIFSQRSRSTKIHLQKPCFLRCHLGLRELFAYASHGVVLALIKCSLSSSFTVSASGAVWYAHVNNVVASDAFASWCVCCSGFVSSVRTHNPLHMSHLWLAMQALLMLQ